MSWSCSLVRFLAVLLLVVSIFVPGLLALIVFTVLWCVCIRPTLYYQQVFGRGPLIRVLRSEEQPMHVAVREPWHTDLFIRHQPSSGFASQNSAPFVTNSELTAAPNFNPLPPLSEEVSSPGPYELRGTPPEHMTFEIPDGEAEDQDDIELEDTFELRRSTGRCGGRCLCARSCYCPPANAANRSTRILSLKPRRIARLPPILPATFLLVACFSIAFGMSVWIALNSTYSGRLLFYYFPVLHLVSFYAILRWSSGLSVRHPKISEVRIPDPMAARCRPACYHT